MPGSGSKRGEQVAWLWVALWTLGIFAAIPLARSIEGFVRDNFGQSAFGWFVIAVVLAATLLALRLVAMRPRDVRDVSTGGLAWLIGIAAVFITATALLWTNPEEAMHFLQYGALGLLLHRALAFRSADASIYIVAAIGGTFIGCIDEAIQWAIPKRYFGFRDIAINGFASVLAQLAIARGLRPAAVSSQLLPEGIRRSCRAAALLLGSLLLFALNTPPRAARWASAIPGLEFLAHNESAMMEYGYRYEVPGIGVFRSRLAPDELAAADAERAAEVGEQLAACIDDYGQFLVDVPPSRDAFLHELCVHLFRRNRYLFYAQRTPDGPEERRKLTTVVAREERVLRNFFGASLAASGLGFPPEQLRELEAEEFAELDYESTVSNDLVTELSEWQLLSAFGAAFVGLALVYRRAGP